ncbi:MAG TPA: acyl carrier protein [Isosphaeraceae bacterium]
MSERTLITLLRVLFFPLYLLMRFIEEVSGEGRWCGRQRRRMASERPPLADREFLRSMRATEDDAPLWLAVRRSMAESCGVPGEAIRPEDRLADLWRLNWMGADLLDLVFRLERALGMKIPRSVVDKGLRDSWLGEFGQFAAQLVAVLRGLRRTHG